MKPGDANHDREPLSPDTGERAVPFAPVFSPHAILNRIFLFLVLAAVLLLSCLDVSPVARVRVRWLETDLPETCRLYIETGQKCPSCGITRSVVCALSGDFERSREFHAAGVAIVAMLLLQVAMRVAFLRRRLRSPIIDIAVSLMSAVAFAVLLNGW